MSESMFDKQMQQDPLGMTKALIAAHIQSALHMYPVEDEQADAAVAQFWHVIEDALLSAWNRRPDPGPVDGLVERLEAWRGFLSGATDHGGLWFGDRHPHLPGAFWWRKLALPVVDEAAAALKAQAARIAELEAVIADPAAVHVNMLRGTIARISIRNCLHVHGVTAQDGWWDKTVGEVIGETEAPGAPR